MYKETVVFMYPTVTGGGFSCSILWKFGARVWVCHEREGRHTPPSSLLFLFLFFLVVVFMGNKPLCPLFLLPPKLIIVVMGDS